MTLAATTPAVASRSWLRPGPFALTLPALLLLTLLFMLPLLRLFSLSFAGGGFGWYEKAL
ncbi:MAG: ABC transporter permease, partial [Acetobacteraceae bacterium]|nr:ABC transporter permease [Acetobacteraceae bacterium]